MQLRPEATQARHTGFSSPHFTLLFLPVLYQQRYRRPIGEQDELTSRAPGLRSQFGFGHFDACIMYMY